MDSNRITSRGDSLAELKSPHVSDCKPCSRLREGLRCTTAARTAAHRILDQSRVCLCAGGLRKRGCEPVIA
jgi:hypothetical protein